MTLSRPFRLALALALLPSPLLAQAMIQPLGTTTADQLADQVRRLGQNPQDLDALLTAGELSLKLDDVSAAGAFFSRADRIDPRNARAKAGEGALLVRNERPGEALRLFAQAEQMGLPVRAFAADRGLAYDLIGDQPRAQRDYRLALAGAEDAEVRRRLALSLGIAGRQREALEALQPLIRQNDRPAWRSRAFILAMGGDSAGASRIAQTMMPPGSAAGLQGFFAELPRLPATDRAFAVHFGEVHPTAARYADARLAPALAPLPPEAAPVQVAAVLPRDDGKKHKKDKKARGGTAVAVALPAPVEPAAQPPAYAAPAYQPRAGAAIAAAPGFDIRAPSVSDRPLTAGELASLRSAGGRPQPARAVAPGFSTPALSTASVGAPASISPGFSNVATALAAHPLTAAEQASVAAATIRPRAPVSVGRTEIAANLPQPRAVATALPVVTPATAVVTPPPRPVVASVAPAVAAGTGSPATPVVTAPTNVATVTAPVVSPASTLPGVGQTVTAAPPVLALPAATATPVGISPTVGAPATNVLTSAPAVSPVASVVATAASQQPVTLASAAPATALPITPAPVAVTPEQPITLASATPPVVTPVTPAPVAVTPAPTRVAAVKPPRHRLGHGEADSILAKIVANLSIPAAELGVDGPTPGAKASRASARKTREADAVADADTKQSRTASRRHGASEVQVAADDEKPTRAGRRRADRETLADADDVKPARGIRGRRAGADEPAPRKGRASDNAVADKEADTDRTGRKAKRAEPERVWVQVATGANEGDLSKAWGKVRDKAPEAFRGRAGYTTPLRATHRVVTGPFKTQAEAQAFVNGLAKKGVSASSFTSDAGQKVTKLDAK